MKRMCWILGMVVLLLSCNNRPIEKPANLIDEEEMTNILYDLTLLDAIKSQSPYDSVVQSIRPKEYIYKKYKIDSLQFVASTQYYISQIETYKKMFDAVNEKLEQAKAANEESLNQSEAPPSSASSAADAPQIQ